MSPLTAKLKCPHGTGEDTYGAEAVTKEELKKGCFVSLPMSTLRYSCGK